MIKSTNKLQSYIVKCTHCHNHEEKNIVQCSLCNNGLEIEIKNRQQIDKSEKTIFTRYRNFFPISDIKLLNKYPNYPTSIIKLPGDNIYAKLEYCSFSSSSKDREAFIEVNMAIQLGYKGIVVASTGNMGAALASLCALYNFTCYVFIPSDTSLSKVKQIKQFGVKIKIIQGTYDDIVPKVMKYAKTNNLFLASLQAFRFEGYKSIAYEIFETFGKKIPKNIIIPLGDATTYVGVWKGFNDLMFAGLIKKMPSFIGVQAEQCSPIVKAYQKGKQVKPILNPKTLAKAIRIGIPLDGDYSLNVARSTNGQMLGYSESEIMKSHKELLKQGINAEYTSALTYCPVIFSNVNNCLLLITGSGLKN